LNITDGKRKRALLLYQVGEATHSIFDTLSETGDNYETAVFINGTPIRMMVDTGASADILDEKSFCEIQKHQNVTLQPTKKRMFAYYGSSSQHQH
jgi:hypothetical protein